jgi:hypothetical protein
MNETVRSHYRRRSRRRGMAMLLALALVALAGAAAVAVTAAVTRDFQRTHREGDDAQLRQLLLAGAADVSARLQAGQGATEAWSVALPKELVDRGGTLRVSPSRDPKDGEIVLTVHAELSRRAREQELHFTRTDGRWRITSASIVP